MVDEDKPERVQRARDQASARGAEVSGIFMGGGGHDKLATLDGSPTGHEVAIVAAERGHSLSPFWRIAGWRVSHLYAGVNTGYSPDARTKRFVREIAELAAHGEPVRLVVFGLRPISYSGRVLLLGECRNGADNKCKDKTVSDHGRFLRSRVKKLSKTTVQEVRIQLPVAGWQGTYRGSSLPGKQMVGGGGRGHQAENAEVVADWRR